MCMIGGCHPSYTLQTLHLGFLKNAVGGLASHAARRVLAAMETRRLTLGLASAGARQPADKTEAMMSKANCDTGH